VLEKTAQELKMKLVTVVQKTSIDDKLIRELRNEMDRLRHGNPSSIEIHELQALREQHEKTIRELEDALTKARQRRAQSPPADGDTRIAPSEQTASNQQQQKQFKDFYSQLNAQRQIQQSLEKKLSDAETKCTRLGSLPSQNVKSDDEQRKIYIAKSKRISRQVRFTALNLFTRPMTTLQSSNRKSICNQTRFPPSKAICDR
jgi:hypothetical protein